MQRGSLLSMCVAQLVSCVVAFVQVKHKGRVVKQCTVLCVIMQTVQLAISQHCADLHDSEQLVGALPALAHYCPAQTADWSS